jgi:predicted DCC family thiol-disulfide oxidoreductase YuxK
MNENNSSFIVLFDGICNLCSSSVSFITKHDKKNRFHFESLQSPEGKEILLKHDLNSSSMNTIVFIENNVAYTKSTAVLRITRYLDGFYPLLFALLAIPTSIRNLVYDFIAKRRYKWFGTIH